MKRQLLKLSAAFSLGGISAYAVAHDRRVRAYNAAQAWINFKEDDEVDAFLHELGSLKRQGNPKTMSTRDCIAQFRVRFAQLEPGLKTGDVVLYHSELSTLDGPLYSGMHWTQHKLSVRSEAGVITHTALVVVVPEEYRTNGGPGALLIDNAAADTLLDATDRVVAQRVQTQPDFRPQDALHIVQASTRWQLETASAVTHYTNCDRLESYIGDSFLLRLKKPLSAKEERRIWRLITTEWERNPAFDKWHLMGSGMLGALPSWWPHNSEDWTGAPQCMLRFASCICLRAEV